MASRVRPGVLHRVVKEGGGHGRRVQAQFGHDGGDRHGVGDVGLARTAELFVVGGGGGVGGPQDGRRLLPGPAGGEGPKDRGQELLEPPGARPRSSPSVDTWARVTIPPRYSTGLLRPPHAGINGAACPCSSLRPCAAAVVAAGRRLPIHQIPTGAYRWTTPNPPTSLRRPPAGPCAPEPGRSVPVERAPLPADLPARTAPPPATARAAAAGVSRPARSPRLSRRWRMAAYRGLALFEHGQHRRGDEDRRVGPAQEAHGEGQAVLLQRGRPQDLGPDHQDREDGQDGYQRGVDRPGQGLVHREVDHLRVRHAPRRTKALGVVRVFGRRPPRCRRGSTPKW